MANNSTAAKRGKNSTNKTVAINVQLPEAVHRKLRVKALSQDLTLAEAVTAAVTLWTR